MSETIYLDYCATTPLHPQVHKAMKEPLEHCFGNPSSLHLEGRKAADLLEHARQQVAEGIGAQSQEIVFTSGATEANNLALRGVLKTQPPDRRHVITCAVEHHAVLHTAKTLQAEGCELTILPVNIDGRVQIDQLRQALRPDTALVSVMMVNNEMGSIQPITELCALTKAHGALFHTDAVQAIGTLAVDVEELGVDLLSLSGHKIYGPKGIGALYVRSGTKLAPLLFGGPQEMQRRAGTENLPGIVGLGAAVQIAKQHKPAEAHRQIMLKAEFIAGLQEQIPDIVVHGGKANQAPHVISIAFPGADAEMLLFRLDQAGIYASMGSACNAELIEPSHVLLALGLPETIIEATLRFSLGLWTTKAELDQVLKTLPEVVAVSKAA
ncbi:MAG: cysteine desulfurase [Anaerolineales bacterium]|nr:cysteine desulfurase [Anaerolineales bacterium]MCK5635443.1 cysteine desulfurase [Anaerolineales bacterium]